MNIQVDKIQILGGEFRILPAEDTGLSPPEHPSLPTLIVGCTYALMSKRGSKLAEGTASNSPVASGSHIELSDATLADFQRFFNSLVHDLANSLESNDDDVKKQSLERILAGNLPR